jgi:TrmH family RNA methyltransferase
MAGTRHKGIVSGDTRREAGNISIVLVEPSGAGNIGSVARAMKNTGFADLVLVNPAPFKNDEGFRMACNASDVLLGARVYPGLSEGLEGTGVIAGATRRLGRGRHPVLTLDEAIPKLVGLSQKNNVSILFGREDKGLKNVETGLCDILFEIPSDELYPSLNLSHAVFIVCYSIFRARQSRGARSTGVLDIKAAPRAEYDEMFVHMESAFRALGYGDKRREYLLGVILRSFRRLFGRTALMQKEVNMLRGIFTQIERRVRTDMEPED